MATEYDRPSHRTTDSSLGAVIALIIALAIGAFIFFTFYDRGVPTTATTPTVTKTVPTTTPAPRSAPAPSTK
jgi:hypothetical protein